MNEHDDEPVRGLPGYLPEGEHILWQGAPDRDTLNRRMFHLRGLAVYFAAIWTYSIVRALTDHAGPTDWRLLVAPPVLGGVAIGLIALYSWLVARTTLYTVTNRRIAIRFGVALSMTVNIPFRQIESAALRAAPDGAGDVVVTLVEDVKLAYLVLWPHTRPWHVSRAEPMLRGLSDAPEAARILARALAASAGIAVRATDTLAVPARASAAGPVTA